MRRLVRHGLVGVVASAGVVVAGVSALASPTTTSMVSDPPAASVAPGEFVPVAYVPADPVADAEHAATAARDAREADRARSAALVADAAYRRAASLSAQGHTIEQHSGQIKAARERAKDRAKAAQVKAARERVAAARERAAAEAAQLKAARERAQAAEAEAAAAAERARQAAITNQGYTPGTTDIHEIARQILANKFSYGDDQFACFSWIISRESGWDVHATNRSSGAYGLPQALPASKMASAGADWRDNPATQITWGVSYMKSRYGSPCDAKSHWQSAGNY